MKIVELQPAPPPQWVIAAGSRVGLDVGRLRRRLPRARRSRTAWKKDAELRGDLLRRARRGDASPSRSQQRASRRFKTCLDLLGQVPVLRRVLAAPARCGSRRTTRPSTTSSTSSAARRRSSNSGLDEQAAAAPRRTARSWHPPAARSARRRRRRRRRRQRRRQAADEARQAAASRRPKAPRRRPLPGGEEEVSEERP